MVAYTIRKIGTMSSVPRASLTVGTVLDDDGTATDAVADRPVSILLDDIPTDSPPSMLESYGVGTWFEDDTMDGVSVGRLVYSDGDGTYSVTEPAGAAGTQVWVFGVVKEIDTVAADTGCVIEIAPQLYEKGA